MPEGHTVHRLAAEHLALLGGSPARTSSPQGRFAAGAQRLDGATLTDTDAHGKHLFHRYRTPAGEQLWLHVHLGLYGTFASGLLPVPPPAGQIRLRLVNGAGYVDLRGPMVCELVEPYEKAALHDRLGADPLRDDADPEQAGERILRSRSPIGQLVMDQSIVAGVGAAYRAELLFRVGVDPYRPGRSLTGTAWHALWVDARQQMRHGVEFGRIDTVRPEHSPSATGRAPRTDRHGGEVYVYRRTGQPCLVCGTPVRAAVLGARNLYWCPRCQS